jgi:hypothetical protein
VIEVQGVSKWYGTTLPWTACRSAVLPGRVIGGYRFVAAVLVTEQRDA